MYYYRTTTAKHGELCCVADDYLMLVGLLVAQLGEIPSDFDENVEYDLETENTKKFVY